MPKAEVHIGTSGWHYKHWLGKFYPAKFPPARMLAYYSQHFSTVEINNSFYRLPPEESLVQWRQTVPEGFCFAVKASRYITHMKRLLDPENAVDRFFSRIELLGPSLGPILFQLPPKWCANAERLENFLSVLPRNHRYVFEFRDQSWCVSRIYDILRRHNAALCLHDWGALPWPSQFTADFAYIRFHGATGDYSGDYSPQTLQQWALQIRGWQSKLKAIYIYFNNDLGGYAITNAQALAKLLHTPASWVDRVA